MGSDKETPRQTLADTDKYWYNIPSQQQQWKYSKTRTSNRLEIIFWAKLDKDSLLES